MRGLDRAVTVAVDALTAFVKPDLDYRSRVSDAHPAVALQIDCRSGGLPAETWPREAWVRWVWGDPVTPHFLPGLRMDFGHGANFIGDPDERQDHVLLAELQLIVLGVVLHTDQGSLVKIRICGVRP